MLPAFALSLLALTSAHAADETMMAKPAKKTNQNLDLVTKNSDGSGVTVRGEFLYLHTRQDGNLYAVTESATTTTTATPLVANSGTAQYNGERWQAGFRLGFGYQFDHDEWDMQLNWAHLFNKNSNKEIKGTILSSLTNPAYTLQGLPLLTPTTMVMASQANSTWNIKTDILDLEIGKEYAPMNSGAMASTMFTVRPHFGLRYAKLTQNLKATYLHSVAPVAPATTPETVTDVVTNSQDFKGIGIRGGVDAEYGFGSGFLVYGKLAASLLAGKFEVTAAEDVLANPGIGTAPATFLGNKTATKANTKSLKAVTDIDLGIGWEKMFADGKYNLRLNLGWEQHIFFNHNQMLRFANTAGNALNANGDLAFSGLKFAVEFGF